jgi:pilus assembly protein Flp/PilA
MKSIHNFAARRMVARWARRQRGVTMIEYALIAALIAVVMVAGLTTLGAEISTTFDKIKAALTAANA